MKDLGEQLLQKWKLLNPALEGLSESEEYLVKHLNLCNPNLLWPKEWPFAALKKALDAVDVTVEERKSEAQLLVKFIQCYYEETNEPCNQSEVLLDSQNLSKPRLDSVIIYMLFIFNCNNCVLASSIENTRGRRSTRSL